jgi:hypothetical protein
MLANRGMRGVIHAIMKKNQITKEQAFHAIETGEFGPEITSSHERVAVLMTQDWCPQWASMRSWIYSLDADLDLYELVYNLTPYFTEFRTFKETRWKNGHIPYVRYYRGGALVAESNYASREEFLAFLGL